MRLPSVPLTATDGRVVVGGELSSHKGINLPTRSIRAPILSDKDRADLAFGLDQGVDYVALSFVRRASDLDPVRKRLSRETQPPLTIAKIETPEGVLNSASILAVCDGLMVARGDLGVELPFEQVPMIQKQLILAANEADKSVITATQMLESMITNPRPTRAEASDVANAVMDGTDAVMLSGETASGNYPVAAVKAMARIVRTAETAQMRQGGYAINRREAAVSSLHDAVALGAERMGRAVGAKLLIGATQGLSTVAALAASRPAMPILGITTDCAMLGRMALLWGVEPIWVPTFTDTGDALRHARRVVTERKLAEPGDFIVLAVGRGPSAEFGARVHLYQMPSTPP
jgi:pyruvate kinase